MYQTTDQLLQQIAGSLQKNEYLENNNIFLINKVKQISEIYHMY